MTMHKNNRCTVCDKGQISIDDKARDLIRVLQRDYAYLKNDMDIIKIKRYIQRNHFINKNTILLASSYADYIASKGLTKY